jgi:hypothetical protein
MTAFDPLPTFVTSSITCLMKLLALTSLLLATSSGATPADPPTRRVPVNVQLTGDDGLSQNLSWALEERLRTHPHLRLAESSGESVVTIRSDSNVGWDRLAGRIVVIYTVFVGRSGGGAEPVTGICYERQMSKCVNDILRLASIQAELP